METAVVVKAEQVIHVLHIEMGMTQVEVGQLPTHIVQDILELRAILLQCPLQRSLADIQRGRNRFHITLALRLPLTQALGDQRTNPAHDGDADNSSS